MNILILSAIAVFTIESVYGNSVIHYLVNNIEKSQINTVIIEPHTQETFAKTLDVFNKICEDNSINVLTLDHLRDSKELLEMVKKIDNEGLKHDQVLYLDGGEDRVEIMAQLGFCAFNVPQLDFDLMMKVVRERDEEALRRSKIFLKKGKVKTVVIDLTDDDSHPFRVDRLIHFTSMFIQECFANDIAVAFLTNNSKTDVDYIEGYKKSTTLKYLIDPPKQVTEFIETLLKNSRSLCPSRNQCELQVLAYDQLSDMRTAFKTMQKGIKPKNTKPQKIILLSSNPENIKTASAMKWKTLKVKANDYGYGFAAIEDVESSTSAKVVIKSNESKTSQRTKGYSKSALS